LDGVAGAVAGNAHNVILVNDAVDQSGIFINDGNAVTLTGDVLDKGVADFTVAYDNNVHNGSFSCKIIIALS
jgi:hypothetical protein